MQVDIRGVETVLTEEVRKYAEEKVAKFSRYEPRIVGVDLGLEEDHNKTEDKAARAKALIKIPGKDIEAIGEGKTIFAAIDAMEEKAKRQLVEHKEKFAKREQTSRSKKLIRRLFRKR